MDQNSHFIESTYNKKDQAFDTPLRPSTLGEFVGQERIKERLEVMIHAAKGRGEPLGHCLFSGPPGLGKTTLCHILARSMGTNMVVTSGPSLEKAGDLAGILTSLNEGDILFVDEVHRLQRSIEEYLYPAMEDFKIDLVIDSGPSARTIQLTLKRFTLVGATTRSGLLSEPLRSRFGTNCRLDFYTPEILKDVVKRTSQLIKMPIDDDGALMIAKRSRGTPRIANHLLCWVRDFSTVRAEGKTDLKVIEEALAMLNIDTLGLDDLDKKILSLLIDQHGGGPVGLTTIAAALGEEPHTLEEVHEPYLIMQGLIKKTPKGRMATPLAYSHIKGACHKGD